MGERLEVPAAERVLPKPVPVWVEVGPMLTASLSREVPLWVRQAGVRVSGDPVAGVLVRRVRSSGGGWLGVCELVMSSANGSLSVELRQLVPVRYITPR